VKREIKVGGRRLTFEAWGADDGVPIFLLHGTPGSRRGPRPRAPVLYQMGVKLISYDRPGYGESDPRPGRTVADAACDVQAIADELKLNAFGVVGRSGGAPHALACAAQLAERVVGVVVLVGLAPSDAEHLDWYEGMAPVNEAEHRSADVSLSALAERQAPAQISTSAVGVGLAERAEQIRRDPQSLLQDLREGLSTADFRVVDDVSIRRQLADTYAEALRDGPEGWIEDAVALRQPWGFDLAKVEQPVMLWHGTEDRFSPIGHARWLADQLPKAEFWLEDGAAHFSAIEALPSALTWVKKAARRSEGLRVQGVQQPPVRT